MWDKALLKNFPFVHQTSSPKPVILFQSLLFGVHSFTAKSQQTILFFSSNTNFKSLQ
jgi:hypothetical protein